MRIGTVTCHHVYNYGATLQAYALQSYLEKLGNDVEVIDYRLPNHRRYELFSLPLGGMAYKMSRAFPPLKYILAPISNRHMFRTYGRKHAFDTFDKQYLHLGKTTYFSSKEIKDNPPEADLYIAGSDQIWNPRMINGNDPGYYLDFGCRDVKRVSYAASFGVKEISQEQGEFVKNQLRRFDSISVREQSGLDILKGLGLNGVRCVDPVFLLSGEEWKNQLHLELKGERYIMLYDFTHDDENIKKYALALKDATGLKIVSINDYENSPYADVQINNAGPREFLEYLFNAQYVVANSFHATAFSLLFHKQFATFPLLSQPNPSRMIDLLDSVGMMRNFKPQDIGLILKEIRWLEIDGKIMKDVSSSRDYINEILAI